VKTSLKTQKRIYNHFTPISKHPSAQGEVDVGADSEIIDVVMCTWNSHRPWFRKCLFSIKREIPVHQFILVDRYSSDETVNVVRSVFPNAIVIQTKANLAVARKIGIEHVDTRYFAFVDDDVELCKGWFTKLLSILKRGRRVGAVSGFTRYFVGCLDKIAVFQLRRRRTAIQEITGRGLTHNTILLTKLIKDFKPPTMVHSWEDYLLTQHVIAKGYRWVEASYAYITHYMNAPSSAREGFLSVIWKEFERAKWDGSGARLVQAYTLPSFLFNVVKNFFYGLVVMVFSRDPRTLVVMITMSFGLLKGFLCFKENIIPSKLRLGRIQDTPLVVRKTL